MIMVFNAIVLIGGIDARYEQKTSSLYKSDDPQLVHTYTTRTQVLKEKEIT